MSPANAPVPPRVKRCSRIALGAAIALIAYAAAPTAVTAQTDVIRGRVTNTEGLPLAGVRVTATSIPGNLTREARTSDRGLYQIAFTGGTGDYMMGFALIGYVFRQFEIKRLADEEVLIADTRLAVIQLDTISVVAPVQQRVNRNSRTPDVGGTEQSINPTILPAEQQGDSLPWRRRSPGCFSSRGSTEGPMDSRSSVWAPTRTA